MQFLVKKLEFRGVQFTSGLTDREVDRAERVYGFVFPADLRAFLQYRLPVSKRWPNWRDGNEVEILDQLDWPAEGICFDIAHNNFWRQDWGDKPADLPEAFAIARRKLAEVPKLIPITGHRYLLADPPLPGNPVLSVYQTDIIPYGNDLASYFANEYKSTLPDYDIPAPDWAAKTLRPIRFWDDFVYGDGSVTFIPPSS